MKIGKRVKRGCALALAAFLGLAGLGYMQTLAADAIDLDAECSVTISVSGNLTEAGDAAVSIPIRMYRVADVDVSGKFTGIHEWAGENFDVGQAGDSANAAKWLELAEEAADRLPEDIAGEEADAKAAGTGTLVIEQGAREGEVTIGNLDVGLYLIVPEDTYNADYSVSYTFTPYLTALPSSNYALYGSGSDSWEYNTEVGLKAEAEQQYGDLVINKSLERFNASLGAVTCVFQVEGTYGNNKTYSNVVSATLNGNEGSVILRRVPAGMTVTVTEVYAGASYTASGDDTLTAAIVSEADPDYEAARASVAFTNDYDGGNRGGYGVTNHFDANADSAQDGQPDENGNMTWGWVKQTTQVSPEE